MVIFILVSCLWVGIVLISLVVRLCGFILVGLVSIMVMLLVKLLWLWFLVFFIWMFGVRLVGRVLFVVSWLRVCWISW